MVVAPTFFREGDGAVRYHAPAEVEIEHDSKGGITGAHLLADGLPVEVGPIEKMAKSKNNGVDPERMIARYGADTVRLYIIETSPPDQMLEWSDRAVEGASKFLRRPVAHRARARRRRTGSRPRRQPARRTGARAALPPPRDHRQGERRRRTPLQVQYRVRRLPRARQRHHGLRREHRRPAERRARGARVRWSSCSLRWSPTSATRCGGRSATGTP